MPDPRVLFIKKQILAKGYDDWVHDAEVCFAAREAEFGDHLLDDFPNDETLGVEQLASLRDEWSAGQERECLPLGIRAVKELVREGLVLVGEVGGQGFVPWTGPVEEVESRLDSLVEEAVLPLLPGDLFWLENTQSGDEKATSGEGPE